MESYESCVDVGTPSLFIPRQPLCSTCGKHVSRRIYTPPESALSDPLKLPVYISTLLTSPFQVVSHHNLCQCECPRKSESLWRQLFSLLGISYFSKKNRRSSRKRARNRSPEVTFFSSNVDCPVPRVRRRPRVEKEELGEGAASPKEESSSRPTARWEVASCSRSQDEEGEAATTKLEEAECHEDDSQKEPVTRTDKISFDSQITSTTTRQENVGEEENQRGNQGSFPIQETSDQTSLFKTPRESLETTESFPESLFTALTDKDSRSYATGQSETLCGADVSEEKSCTVDEGRSEPENFEINPESYTIAEKTAEISVKSERLNTLSGFEVLEDKHNLEQEQNSTADPSDTNEKSAGSLQLHAHKQVLNKEFETEQTSVEEVQLNISEQEPLTQSDSLQGNHLKRSRQNSFVEFFSSNEEVKGNAQTSTVESSFKEELWVHEQRSTTEVSLDEEGGKVYWQKSAAEDDAQSSITDEHLLKEKGKDIWETSISEESSDIANGNGGADDTPYPLESEDAVNSSECKVFASEGLSTGGVSTESLGAPQSVKDHDEEPISEPATLNDTRTEPVPESGSSDRIYPVPELSNNQTLSQDFSFKLPILQTVKPIVNPKETPFLCNSPEVPEPQINQDEKKIPARGRSRQRRGPPVLSVCCKENTNTSKALESKTSEPHSIPVEGQAEDKLLAPGTAPDCPEPAMCCRPPSPPMCFAPVGGSCSLTAVCKPRSCCDPCCNPCPSPPACCTPRMRSSSCSRATSCIMCGRMIFPPKDSPYVRKICPGCKVICAVKSCRVPRCSPFCSPRPFCRRICTPPPCPPVRCCSPPLCLPKCSPCRPKPPNCCCPSDCLDSCCTYSPCDPLPLYSRCYTSRCPPRRCPSPPPCSPLQCNPCPTTCCVSKPSVCCITPECQPNGRKYFLSSKKNCTSCVSGAGYYRSNHRGRSTPALSRFCSSSPGTLDGRLFTQSFGAKSKPSRRLVFSRSPSNAKLAEVATISCEAPNTECIPPPPCSPAELATCSSEERCSKGQIDVVVTCPDEASSSNKEDNCKANGETVEAAKETTTEEAPKPKAKKKKRKRKKRGGNVSNNALDTERSMYVDTCRWHRRLGGRPERPQRKQLRSDIVKLYDNQFSPLEEKSRRSAPCGLGDFPTRQHKRVCGRVTREPKPAAGQETDLKRYHSRICLNNNSGGEDFRFFRRYLKVSSVPFSFPESAGDAEDSDSSLIADGEDRLVSSEPEIIELPQTQDMEPASAKAKMPPRLLEEKISLMDQWISAHTSEDAVDEDGHNESAGSLVDESLTEEVNATSKKVVKKAKKIDPDKELSQRLGLGKGKKSGAVRSGKRQTVSGARTGPPVKIGTTMKGKKGSGLVSGKQGLQRASSSSVGNHKFAMMDAKLTAAINEHVKEKEKEEIAKRRSSMMQIRRSKEVIEEEPPAEQLAIEMEEPEPEEVEEPPPELPFFVAAVSSETSVDPEPYHLYYQTMMAPESPAVADTTQLTTHAEEEEQEEEVEQFALVRPDSSVDSSVVVNITNNTLDNEVTSVPNLVTTGAAPVNAEGATGGEIQRIDKPALEEAVRNNAQHLERIKSFILEGKESSVDGECFSGKAVTTEEVPSDASRNNDSSSYFFGFLNKSANKCEDEENTVIHKTAQTGRKSNGQPTRSRRDQKPIFDFGPFSDAGSSSGSDSRTDDARKQSAVMWFKQEDSGDVDDIRRAKKVFMTNLSHPKGNKSSCGLVDAAKKSDGGDPYRLSRVCRSFSSTQHCLPAQGIPGDKMDKLLVDFIREFGTPV